MNWPMSGGCDSGDRQTIVDHLVSIAADPGHDGRLVIDPLQVMRAQPGGPQVLVMKVVPRHKPIVAWPQAKVVAIPNAMTMESQADTSNKMRAWRQWRPTAVMIIVTPRYP